MYTVHVCHVPESGTLAKRKEASSKYTNELHHVFHTMYSYYQKVPAELPELEKKQVYGLATPEDLTLPPHHTLWTEEAYTAFQVTSEASEKYDTKVSTPTLKLA